LKSASTLLLLAIACEATRQPVAGPPSVRPRASVAEPRKPEQARLAASANVVLPSRDAEATSLRLNPVADVAWPPQRHAPRPFYGKNGLQILTQDCLATVHAGSIEPGRYPLPGRACREPLQQSWEVRGSAWLLAGQDLWQRHQEGGWEKRATLAGAERVFLPTRVDEVGLALVAPYRQRTRSAWQSSSGLELRALPGRPPVRVPRLAVAPPPHAGQPSLDDYAGSCFTRTRLSLPRGFHVTKDGKAMIFGSECDRSTLEVRGTVESWRLGEAQTTLELLPFPSPQSVSEAQLRDDDDLWVAGDQDLLHFDGKAWAIVPGPQGVAPITHFAVSPTGAIWLSVGTELWNKPAGATWQRQASLKRRRDGRLLVRR
jgi:hypothetical protein